MRTLFILLFALCAQIGFAQDDFQGVINYEITYEDMSDEIKQMEAMLPKSTTVEMRDGISKMTQPNGMGGETVTISNIESGESLVLINMMGNKIAMKSNKEDTEKLQEEADVNIEYLEETKEIAGYECKKAVITGEDDSEVVVYYTKEIPTTKVGNAAAQIDGFPMMMEVSQEMFTMIMTVTEVKKEKVKKIKMEVPEDYTLKTMEELQQMMGGGM